MCAEAKGALWKVTYTMHDIHMESFIIKREEEREEKERGRERERQEKRERKRET